MCGSGPEDKALLGQHRGLPVASAASGFSVEDKCAVPTCAVTGEDAHISANVSPNAHTLLWGQGLSPPSR